MWDGTTLAEPHAAGRATTWVHDGTRRLTQTERPLVQEEFDERFYAIVTDLVGAPAELVKGKSLARDRRIAVCISHERQPYSFVAIEVRSQWPER